MNARKARSTNERMAYWYEHGVYRWGAVKEIVHAAGKKPEVIVREYAIVRPTGRTVRMPVSEVSLS
jgi:hypothetical protein